MKLLSIGHHNGHIFMVCADSPRALQISLRKHGFKLAEQLVGDEPSIADKFLRMRQLAAITDTAKAYETH